MRFHSRLAVLGAFALVVSTVLFVPQAHAMPSCAGEPATHVGTGGPDVITGTPGDDVIVTWGGDDIINAGAGNDLVCSGDGDDIVVGGPGDDIIKGWNGNDRLFGDDADCIDSVAGTRHDIFNCVLAPGADGGDDVLDGGPGDDFLDGEVGADLLLGGADEDVLVSGPEPITGIDNRLFGAAGDDDISVHMGNASAFGKEGNDTFFASGDANSHHRLFGQDGDDTFGFETSGLVEMFGGAGNDYSSGGGDAEARFFGGADDDVYTGSLYDLDSLFARGGSGNDEISAPFFVQGTVFIHGGPGDDLLGNVSGDENSLVRGGIGNDVLIGRDLQGDEGDDELFVLRTRRPSFFERGGPGNDRIYSPYFGDAAVSGGPGDDQIFVDENFTGTVSGSLGIDACGDPTGNDYGCEQLQDGIPLTTLVFDPQYPDEEYIIQVDIWWDVPLDDIAGIYLD